MRVAVTGGTGVVGQALIRHLIYDGHEVRALARSPESSDSLRSLGAIPVPGDILEPTSLRPLVDGCDVAFNVAGVNELCVRDTSQMEAVNVTGVRNMIAACRRSDLGRLVHTSSAATIGEARGVVADEASAHRGHFLSQYERTKYLGEQVLFEESSDLDFVCVNPSSVQGPGRSTGTARLILDLINGRLPALVDTSISIVDIDDCARGHVLAAQKGSSATRYLLSGTTMTVRDAVRIAGDITGRELSTLFVPGALASALVAVAQPIAQLAGRNLPFCREMIRVMRFGHTYDGSKAARELGLEYTPIHSTLERLVAWFDAEGLLE